MGKVFIEEHEDGWIARRNKQVVSSGSTQGDLGEAMHNRYPEDVIYGERVRRGNNEKPKPDKWRVLYPSSE
jgi:hypothetical protein